MIVRTEKNQKKEIVRVLSAKLRSIVEKVKVDFCEIQEIRIRTGSPLIIVCEGKEYLVGEDGSLGVNRNNSYEITQREIRETMEYISNYSLYAFEEELKQGFITIQGGHRVGVAGKIILEKERVKNIRHISFLNIRLAHEIIGCADKVLPYITHKESIYHTLIISPPRCGKTTLLRDLIRQLSDGTRERRGMNVGVVDERSEIGACYQGQPQNDIGYRTDVLDCCPKKDGMMMMVRSMSPEIIAVDEIGYKDDVEALEYVMNSGVKVLATVHGNNMEEIRNKPVLGRMVQEKAFQRYILLSEGQVGKIKAVFDERGSYLRWVS